MLAYSMMWGKLNPYYQILFSSGQVNGDYLRAHAIFSALAVNWLANIAALQDILKSRYSLQWLGTTQNLLSSIKALDFCYRDKERFERSFKDTYDNLYRFSQTARELEEFKDLDWEYCLSQV